MEVDKNFFKENFFRIERYRVSADKPGEDDQEVNEAAIKILVPAKKAKGKVPPRYIAEYQPDDKNYIALSASANGDGPVDALDSALRKALVPIYPFLSEIRLIRYSVDNISFKDGTSAEVEVFILSSNSAGKLYYSESRSRSIIEASFSALANIYNRYYRDEHSAPKKPAPGKSRKKK